MLLYGPNPVDSFGISHDLSTSPATNAKLFMFDMMQAVRLQTMFGRPQVVEITVENSLVHRRWLGLSTTTIEI